MTSSKPFNFENLYSKSDLLHRSRHDFGGARPLPSMRAPLIDSMRFPDELRLDVAGNSCFFYLTTSRPIDHIGTAADSLIERIDEQ